RGLGLLPWAVYVTSVWVFLRLARRAFQRGIWRLRNRLLAAYLFMAVVPILLIATLALVGIRMVSSQLAVYLVTSELDRRIDGLQVLGQSVADQSPAERRIDPNHLKRYPGISILLREAGHETRYPAGARIPTPLEGWKTTQGVMLRDRDFYLWSYQKTAAGDITVTAPMTQDYLSGLVPHIGQVGFGTLLGNSAQLLSQAPPGTVPVSRVPGPFIFLDPEVRWFAAVPAFDWEHPGNASTRLIIAVRSRATALAAAMYDPDADQAQAVQLVILALLVSLFVIVELVAFIIGVRLTRSMTGAVHRLYEGTQRAAAGDFSRRIEVNGHDQLAELSLSFNRMTQSIQHLLTVAKEKERLQSEMDIASEVQNRLYPRTALHTASLRVTGVCHPARVVSGDYFDYEPLPGSRMMLAIGDVAGKGISAALLMASLQSSLRAQLAEGAVSTSQLVSRVNQQLHASTAPEKFATLCAGTFDETLGVFTYTNAGHLPPLVVRNGTVERLEVNGMVVGAFPLTKYSESQVELKCGDLLVFFTDGITEPENAYGEMFGEDRLAELISRHAHLNEDQIMEAVWKSVGEWSGDGELADDRTLLLARKL
ncbi:MAG: PP2C family protein-serine/threonine phosphatase, partial [Acidobacteriota bacterium]|nr:PP2C family protein-serine/threonine phosphatase [Acidobacteriota bacterium]